MKVIINGKDIKSEHDFHKQIAEALDFPKYYGSNLDALWDVLSTDIERPITLIWKDAKYSRVELDSSYEKIIKILQRVEEQDINFGFEDQFKLVLE
ncbi:barnase inhibitor [Pokkaliibacter plantistimulans]|uniref:Barnase inhibitor n=1 Tax=Pokkaliibacter plantistimulans TaxID=1635171 RepID=A0ABX5LTL1_9GAMM|nr:barstar family protein [Pokkaliibacter plantistimulans]PXF29992.1 barnase inhibitor [Pokkaliibacter plantistimulans]